MPEQDSRLPRWGEISIDRDSNDHATTDSDAKEIRAETDSVEVIVSDSRLVSRGSPIRSRGNHCRWYSVLAST